MTTPLTKSSPIIIIGAGVFSLSTALHLSEAGYINVAVFDRQPYVDNAYSTATGADAASADMNKVMRLSYGKELLYQKLAFEAIDVWNEWNDKIAMLDDAELPKGLQKGDKVWTSCGFLMLSKDEAISQFELDTLAGLKKEGLRDTQYHIGDAHDEERAAAKRLQARFDPMGLRKRGRKLVGVYDTLGGYVSASKACTWVLRLLSKTNIRSVLGSEAGTITDFVRSNTVRTTGVQTADGKKHSADLVVVAAGPWTPTLIPQVRGMLEATAGSVAYLQLPPKAERRICGRSTRGAAGARQRSRWISASRRRHHENWIPWYKIHQLKHGRRQKQGEETADRPAANGILATGKRAADHKSRHRLHQRRRS